MQQIKFFTKELLMKGNKIAMANNANRQLTDEIEHLPEMNFPVLFSMIHDRGTECDIRCQVALPTLESSTNDLKNIDLSTAFIDVPIEFFNKLPTAEIPETNEDKS